MSPEAFLSLEVHSPSGLRIQIERISSLNVRLDDGSLLGIRPGHARLIASAAKGVLHYIADGKHSTLKVEAGFLTVNDNVVKILTTA